jgi:hypothetical protein
LAHHCSPTLAYPSSKEKLANIGVYIEPVL